MKTPASNLFDHTYWPLSDAERASLPSLEWLAYTAPEYQHMKTTNTVGTWYIGHPPSSGKSHNPVDISFHVPFEEGETYASVMDANKTLSTKDPQWWLNHAKCAHQEVGYVYDREYAMAFIQRAIRYPPRKTPEEILLEGGFMKKTHSFGDAHDKGVFFEKEDGRRGVFAVALSENTLSMTHEKRHSRYWTNLLRVSRLNIGQDDTKIPKFFSPLVEDPIAAAADMAVYFTLNWQPYRKPKKSEEGPKAAPRRSRP